MKGGGERECEQAWPARCGLSSSRARRRRAEGGGGGQWWRVVAEGGGRRTLVVDLLGGMMDVGGRAAWLVGAQPASDLQARDETAKSGSFSQGFG